ATGPGRGDPPGRDRPDRRAGGGGEVAAGVVAGRPHAARDAVPGAERRLYGACPCAAAPATGADERLRRRDDFVLETGQHLERHLADHLRVLRRPDLFDLIADEPDRLVPQLPGVGEEVDAVHHGAADLPRLVAEPAGHLADDTAVGEPLHGRQFAVLVDVLQRFEPDLAGAVTLHDELVGHHQRRNGVLARDAAAGAAAVGELDCGQLAEPNEPGHAVPNLLNSLRVHR